MNEKENQRPGKILLATDLSCRCDRALDRAVNVAGAWGTGLVASTVVDHGLLIGDRMSGSGEEDPVIRARRRLAADVACMDVKPVVKVRTGDVVEQLLLLIEEEEAGLVVTGVARNNWMRAVVLGTVVDALMRHSKVPTLVVRNRVRGPYRNIVVAGDFSELSRHALAQTLAWFPEAEVTFFHAVDVSYADLGDADRESLDEQARASARAEAQAFVDGAGLPEEQRARVRIVCGCGASVDALNHHLRREGGDLVAVGAHGRGVLFEILVGSKAKQIVENIESDVLVFRNPPPGE